MSPVPSTVAEWAVLLFTTGGVGKFVYDLTLGKNGRRRDRAEGDKTKAEAESVVVDTAQNVAKQALEAASAATAALDEYRREQARRWAQLDVQFQRHGKWDRDMRSRLETLTGESVPEPPPLYVD
jgi:hypothetical protein